MQKICFCAALFCAAVSLYAQTPAKLNSTESYWVKPSPPVDTLQLKSGDYTTGYLNFNKPVSFSELKLAKKTGALIAKKSSLFIVFRSSSKEEVELLDFSLGLSKGVLTSKKLTTEEDYAFNKANPAPGVLVSHIFNKNSLISRKKGTLEFSDALFNDKEGINSLFELIYIPDALGEKPQNSIESYLSIKYGISKLGEKDYTDSTGDTIWNYKKNAAYSHRVTGIGRDDKNTLYQKQSGNAVNDGVYIGLGKIAGSNWQNKGKLADKAYLLWGDNDLETTFETTASASVSGLKKVWKANKAGIDTLNTQLIINKRLLGLIHKPGIPGDALWLVTDASGSGRINFESAEYFPASEENDSLVVFNDVKWNSRECLFTLAKAPDLILDYDKYPSCTSGGGKVDIVIKGGSAPFSVTLNSGTFKKEFTTEKRDITITDLVTGAYTISVEDKFSKIQNDTFSLDPFSNDGSPFPSAWTLNGSTALVINAPVARTEGAKCIWYLNNRVISQETQLTTEIPGNYKVAVTTAEGCLKEFLFTINDVSGDTARNFSVYPNPCKSNEQFTISISQPGVQDTSVTITDIHGKILLYKELGKISEAVVKSSLVQEATYMITVTSGNTQQTAKIIIL